MIVYSFRLNNNEGLNLREFKFINPIYYSDALKQINDSLLESSLPNGTYNYCFDISFESQQTIKSGTLNLIR